MYQRNHIMRGTSLFCWFPDVTISLKFRRQASKTRKKKVMFFAAVYAPRLELDSRLDGKLFLKVAHLERVPHNLLIGPADPEFQERESKFASRGEVVFDFNSNMNRTMYVAFCKEMSQAANARNLFVLPFVDFRRTFCDRQATTSSKESLSRRTVLGATEGVAGLE